MRLIFLSFLSFTVPLSCSAAQLSPPNIVVILADDLGYADVGYHGSDIQTPHIDSIAREGVSLERFYSCPMCSPTRAGFLTGRWPHRFGMMRAVVPPWCSYGLPNEEITLPELLGKAGYEQRGIIGKWHLGHSTRNHHPLEHGFTYFYGHYNGAIDYFTHEREGEVDWHRNRETIKEEGYTTDLLSEDAARFIRDAPRNRPYFLYVPFNAPHSPFQAKEEDLAKYPKRKGKKKILAAMIDCLDQGVGRILNAIDQRDDVQNTFVLFFSDNGGVKGIADNSPWRGHKLTPYEGGTRVVACARGPAWGISGGRKVNEKMGYIDLLPTLCTIAGAELPSGHRLDGINVLPALSKSQPLPERSWFTYEAQKSDRERNFAVTRGKWKSIVKGPGLFSRRPEEITNELYNLESDPKEERNVLIENRPIASELMQDLIQFYLEASKSGVPPYSTGREGFVAPKDWLVE